MVSNSLCKQSLVGGLHSEGSGGLSLQVQHEKQKSVYIACNALWTLFIHVHHKERLKKPVSTVSYTQRFEGRAGLNCIGGVNEVQRGTEDPRQNIGQLLPHAVHAKQAETFY